MGSFISQGAKGKGSLSWDPVEKKARQVNPGQFDIKQVKELIELMEKHGLVEIEVQQEGRKIRLRKEPAAQVAPPAQPPPKDSHVPGPPEEPARTQSPGLREIRSPMVGTFYRAPSPDADPFVEVGDSVREGDVLCIIEAMKVMNEIRAECSGIIEEILVENGQPVEYGEVLFLIRPE